MLKLFNMLPSLIASLSSLFMICKWPKWTQKCWLNILHKRRREAEMEKGSVSSNFWYWPVQHRCRQWNCWKATRKSNIF